MKKNYQIVVPDSEKVAKARASNAPASLKFSTEIAREVKGQPLKKAMAWLERVQRHETFIPLRRYNKLVPHRKGDAQSFMKSGRYSDGTVAVWLKLLESVKANADYRGLDAENLLITHVFASKGFSRMGMQPKGRIGGKRRARKSAHLEVVVREAK